MFWNKSMGALDLWQGVTAYETELTGTFSYTQYLISPHWNRGKSLSTLEAADLNGDGVPDLWAVTSNGTARAYNSLRPLRHRASEDNGRAPAETVLDLPPDDTAPVRCRAVAPNLGQLR